MCIRDRLIAFQVTINSPNNPKHNSLSTSPTPEKIKNIPYRIPPAINIIPVEPQKEERIASSFSSYNISARNLVTTIERKLVTVREASKDVYKRQVYSLGKNSEFGRLEIASKEIRSEFPNSIRISKYQAAISELEDGNVWVNRELLPDYPAYMAGIRKNKELVMIVCIKEVRSDQMTLYYMNLFKILCGLAVSYTHLDVDKRQVP